MPNQVTLSDVARAANVSPATASRVLGGTSGRRVRPDLAERVHAAAAELGYSVNVPAQSVARGATTTLGLIVHDIADPYASAIASGVIDAAAQRGLTVTIASSQSDPAAEVRQVRALHGQRARAVILAGSRFADRQATAELSHAVRAYVAGGGRVAAIGQDLLGVPTVTVPNAAGAQGLASTLCAMGYRRFVVLAGPEQFVTSEDRLAGFRAGLAESGVELAPENVIGAQLTRDGGYVAMRELTDQGLDADVIFAVNDVMAVGAMTALREQGYRLPADVAIAGFDDIAMLRDIDPPLTTVRLPLVEMGARAVDLALGPEPSADVALRSEPPVEEVAAEVVVRASTPPRGTS